MIEPHKSPLLTDFYQFTMLQAYFAQGMNDIAVFEFFVRRLPQHRGFLLAAGLEQAFQFLEGLHFTDEELEWLRASGRFNQDFINQLGKLHFTGDVHAMPEGTVFFADEPILRVTAPITEAQLVETRLINLLHFQTLVASKAARVVLSAQGKLLVDFGMRRAHGAEAALFAARASYIAGFDGTSDTLAGVEFGIPTFGTMAHSFIQADHSEKGAFEHFARAQPENVTLLIDTYDTEAAAHKVAQLAPRLQKAGITIKAVRLDSGDLALHAHNVRRILDDASLREISIFSSGNLDEHALRDLISRGAPIDGFGVGTAMATSADAPFLDCAYKLQEYAGIARRKRSEGKATWPGRKQVYRAFDANGIMTGDVLTLETDRQPGEALIRPVMQNGKRVQASETLEIIRRRATEQLRQLPRHLHELEKAPPYPVIVAPLLRELAIAVDLGLLQN